MRIDAVSLRIAAVRIDAVSLRTRLTVAFVLVMFVPLVLGVVVAQRSQLHLARAEQQLGVAAASRLAAATVASYCDRAFAAATLAARSLPGADPAEVATDVVARRLADGVRIAGPDGRSVAAGDAPPLRPEVSCTRAVPATGVTVIAAVVPLTANGRDAGWVAASYAGGDELAGKLAGVAGSGTLALLSGEAAVGTSGDLPAGLLGSAIRAPVMPVAADGYVAMLTPGRAGQPLAVLLAQRQVRAVGLPPYTLAVGLGGLLLSLLLAYQLAGAITRPLAELGAAVGRVAGGDLDTHIAVRSGDEVGRLGLAVNAMTTDLRAYVGELQASRHELRSGLLRLGSTLSSTHDRERIVAVVLQTAMAAVRAGGGMVLLSDPAGRELVVTVVAGVDVPVGTRLRLGEGVSGRVALTGEAVRGVVSERVDELAPELAPGPGEPGVHSLVSVPLRGAGGVVGVLDLYDRRSGDGLHSDGFDEEDLDTLRTFASQATVALDNVKLHEEAQWMSITDGLTELYNYRHFTGTLAREVERAARFGRPLSLLVLDLDRFKLVNDTYGHQRGDDVLVELAARVRAVVRDVDTVARYGGEEFVVLLPETDETGVAHTAARLCEAVRRIPFGAAGDEPLEVTASVGGAVLHGAAGTAGELLRQADEALYDAKRAGRDTWRLWPVTDQSSEPSSTARPDSRS